MGNHFPELQVEPSRQNIFLASLGHILWAKPVLARFLAQGMGHTVTPPHAHVAGAALTNGPHAQWPPGADGPSRGR